MQAGTAELCAVAICSLTQNTPHSLSKHSSQAGGLDRAANPSPPHSADNAAALAAAATAAMDAGSSSYNGSQGHGSMSNGDAVPFLSHSNRGSAGGGLQQFSSAQPSEMGLLASSTTNGGQYSAAGGYHAGTR